MSLKYSIFLDVCSIYITLKKVVGIIVLLFFLIYYIFGLFFFRINSFTSRRAYFGKKSIRG